MASIVMDCGRIVNRRERRARVRRDYARCTWYAVQHLERYGRCLMGELCYRHHFAGKVIAL